MDLSRLVITCVYCVRPSVAIRDIHVQSIGSSGCLIYILDGEGDFNIYTSQHDGANLRPFSSWETLLQDDDGLDEYISAIHLSKTNKSLYVGSSFGLLRKVDPRMNVVSEVQGSLYSGHTLNNGICCISTSHVDDSVLCLGFEGKLKLFYGESLVRTVSFLPQSTTPSPVYAATLIPNGMGLVSIDPTISTARYIRWDNAFEQPGTGFFIDTQLTYYNQLQKTRGKNIINPRSNNLLYNTDSDHRTRPTTDWGVWRPNLPLNDTTIMIPSIKSDIYPSGIVAYEANFTTATITGVLQLPNVRTAVACTDIDVIYGLNSAYFNSCAITAGKKD